LRIVRDRRSSLCIPAFTLRHGLPPRLAFPRFLFVTGPALPSHSVAFPHCLVTTWHLFYFLDRWRASHISRCPFARPRVAYSPLRVLLPSTQSTAKCMSYIRIPWQSCEHCSRADLFVTFTCNTACPEIDDTLLPGQQLARRPSRHCLSCFPAQA
jgi:hypothetical protein